MIYGCICVRNYGIMFVNALKLVTIFLKSIPRKAILLFLLLWCGVLCMIISFDVSLLLAQEKYQISK